MAKGKRGGKYHKESSSFYYEIQDRYLEDYNFREVEKESMTNALNQVKKVIDSFMSDSWTSKDVDHLYEMMADNFPRSMESDDADRVISADGDYITLVRADFWEDAEGRIQVILEPHSHSYDDFSDRELADLGIERRNLSSILADKKVEAAVEKAFHKANLEGDSADIYIKQYPPIKY